MADVIMATEVSRKDEHKPRFEIKQRRATVDDWDFPLHAVGTNRIATRIRTIQGHSTGAIISRDVLKIGDEKFPEVLLHGTVETALTSIRQRGLMAGGLKGNRDDVHFYPVLAVHRQGQF